MSNRQRTRRDSCRHICCSPLLEGQAPSIGVRRRQESDSIRPVQHKTPELPSGTHASLPSDRSPQCLDRHNQSAATDRTSPIAHDRVCPREGEKSSKFTILLLGPSRAGSNEVNLPRYASGLLAPLHTSRWKRRRRASSGGESGIDVPGLFLHAQRAQHAIHLGTRSPLCQSQRGRRAFETIVEPGRTDFR